MAELAAYLKQQNESVTDFARRVGISRVSVSRILHGKQTPSRELLVKIYDVTSGAVTANDFMHPEMKQASGEAAE